MSSCVAQEENPVRNHFEIDHTAPHASSSYISPLPREPRGGFSYLTDLLLHIHSSGITACPFIADINTLQKSVCLHGIVVCGLSHEEYKTILLRHIFGGDCLQSPDNNDHTACRCFAQNLNSAREMTQSAFDMMSSARSNQRSTNELFFLFRALELTTAFKSQNLRRQIVRELKNHFRNFVTAITASKQFCAFEKHDRPTLLSIASSHRVQVD
jgi:hypothetical protein